MKYKTKEVHLRLDKSVADIYAKVKELSPVKISTNAYIQTALFEKASKDLETLKDLSTVKAL